MYGGLVSLEQFCLVIVVAQMYVSLRTGLRSGSLKLSVCMIVLF